MLALFSAAGFLEVVAWGQLSAFTPLYLPTFGISAAEVPGWVAGITVSSSALGLPFLPFWGALADRYGRKPLIIRSFVFGFVALAITAVAPNVWIFAIARAFQALALGNTGLMMTTLAEHAPRGRVAFAFGVLNGANPLGAFVGPLVGGPIVDRLGFPFLVAIDAALMALIVGGLTLGYRDAFEPRRDGPSLSAAAAEGTLVILRSPRLRALFPALFVLFAGWISAYLYVPLVVARIHEGPDLATTVGIVLGAGGLVTLVASPAIGALADRLGVWRVLVAGGSLLALLWLVPFFTTDIVAFTVAWAVVNGAATGIFAISFSALVGSTTNETRARVMTFSYLPANVGFIVGGAVGGVAATADVQLVFPAAAALTALGVVAVALARRQPL